MFFSLLLENIIQNVLNELFLFLNEAMSEPQV